MYIVYQEYYGYHPYLFSTKEKAEEFIDNEVEELCEDRTKFDIVPASVDEWSRSN